MEAEPLRDSLLQISGQLDLKVGGTIWTFENYKLVFNHTSEDATTYSSNRRAIYLPVIRNHVYDLFELFDFPDPGTVNGNRADTTIAPQALYLMNSPLVLPLPAQRWRNNCWTKNSTTVSVSNGFTRKFTTVNLPPKESKSALAFVNEFCQERHGQLAGALPSFGFVE